MYYRKIYMVISAVTLNCKKHTTMDNPEVRTLMYYAFGLFYMLCLMGAAYALMYYGTH